MSLHLIDDDLTPEMMLNTTADGTGSTGIDQFIMLPQGTATSRFHALFPVTAP